MFIMIAIFLTVNLIYNQINLSNILTRILNIEFKG